MKNISDYKLVIKVKDHFLSKEGFELKKHPDLDILITYPQPSLEILPEYYKSEDYISHTNKSTTLFEKLYQFVKQKNIRSKTRLMTSYLQPGKNYLDIGTGTGDLLLAMKQVGYKAKGIEPNPDARAIGTNNGLDIVPSIQQFENKSFDLISMFHVLEHVPDYELQVKRLYQLLTHEGVVVIAVPNYKSFDARFYKSNWAAYDVPRHLFHFSKSGLKAVFEKEGFELVKTKPMFFDAFYVSILSSGYAGHFLKPITGCIIGALSNLVAVFSKEYSSNIFVFKRK